MPDPAASTSSRGVPRALAWIVAAAAIAIGVGFVLVAVTLGDCSAFGGRCPADPQPLLEDDTFGTAAFGAALATGVPVFVARPSLRRFVAAVAIALAAAIVVGLIARSAANS